MLKTIKGIYENGKIKLLEKIKIKGRRKVIITLINDKKKKKSILDLSGLGKRIWKDIDAQQYVREERKSWG
jgi:predicted DNA-binding antitoxin AbrB/MazE fold protein